MLDTLASTLMRRGCLAQEPCACSPRTPAVTRAAADKPSIGLPVGARSHTSHPRWPQSGHTVACIYGSTEPFLIFYGHSTSSQFSTAVFFIKSPSEQNVLLLTFNLNRCLALTCSPSVFPSVPLNFGICVIVFTWICTHKPP